MSAEPNGTRTVRFNCELCQSLCGMVATVENDELVKVVADRHHPISGGYSCAKGRAIAERHRTRRLDAPTVRGEPVEWPELLDDLGGQLERLVAERGVDAIGVYQATGAAIGAYQAPARFFAKLGTQQRYSVRTLDAGPAYRAAELVTGSAYRHPVWQPERSPSLAVLVGINPAVSGGYIGTGRSSWPSRMRDFQRAGGELWVVDPRATATASRAERHLAPRPGTDVLLLALVVRELLESGHDPEEVAGWCRPEDVERLRRAVAPFLLEVVAERTGLPAADLVELVDAIRRHGQVAVMSGTGLGFQPDGVVAYWLAWTIMILTGSLDREGGLAFIPLRSAVLDDPTPEPAAPEEGSHTPGPSSRPELEGLLGELPGASIADEIEAGNLRALFLFGGNPITAAPDPDRMAAALAQLEVLVVLDVFENDLTDLATHVVPCTWLTERASFVLQPVMVPRAYFSPAVVAPSAGRRHPWWFFAKLGRRLGVDLLDGLDPDTTTDEAVAAHFGRTSDPGIVEEVLAAGVDGVALRTRIGWVHEKGLRDGRWRIAPPVLVRRLEDAFAEPGAGPRLICGRLTGNVNATRYGGLDDAPPPLRLSADVAEDGGVQTGDLIRLSTEQGAVEGRAEVDPKLGRGSVWVSHGWMRQNVNRLVDPHPDPLTAQPVFTGFPVAVDRVDGPADGADAPTT